MPGRAIVSVVQIIVASVEERPHIIPVEVAQVEGQVEAVVLNIGVVAVFEDLEHLPGDVEAIQLPANFVCQLRRAAAPITPVCWFRLGFFL